MKQRILSAVEGFYAVTEESLTMLSPLLAPVPSAVAVYFALSGPMGWAWAAVSALAIEGVGITAARLSLRSVTESAPKVVVAWSMVMSAIYLMTVWLLLGTLPHGDLGIAVMAFPLLTVVGASALAIKWALDKNASRAVDGVLQQLEIDAAQERQRMQLAAERKRMAAETKAVQAQLSQNAHNSSRGTRPASGSDADVGQKWDSVGHYVSANPWASLREVADETGVPRSTAQRRLAADGWHKNGAGWKRVE